MLLLKEGRNYSIRAECPRSEIPKGFSDLRFNKIISTILGKRKFVSIVFVRQEKMRRLNKKYRKKDRSTDALSFNLSNSGEIFFSLNDIRIKAKSRKLKAASYLPYLLIHALLHLKGEGHGSKMDRLEMKYCKIFQIKYPSNEF